MKRELVMVGGWTALFEKAKACGFDLTLIHDKSELTATDFAVADRVITVPMNDPEVPAIVAALSRSVRFDAAISFQEFGVLNAARICDAQGIFGNPLSAVELGRDKGRMRQRLEDAGIASVPFSLATSVEEVIAFANKNGWPVIVKPVNASGSDCVQKLVAPSEARPAFERIVQKHPHQHVLVEQFLVGPEISVEAITWDGSHRVLGVTDKITTGAPHFVELGHTHPSSLPGECVRQVETLTLQVLDAMGHRFGPSHVEIIVTAEGPRLVEAHTRTGGDRIFEMVEIVHGVDMFTATLQGFAGQFPRIDAAPEKAGAAIRYFNFPAGDIAEISGVEEAGRMPGVVRVEHWLDVGKVMPPLRYSGDRMGYVLASGRDSNEAAQRAEAALAMIDVRVSPTLKPEGRPQ